MIFKALRPGESARAESAGEETTNVPALQVSDMWAVREPVNDLAKETAKEQ